VRLSKSEFYPINRESWANTEPSRDRVGSAPSPSERLFFCSLVSLISIHRCSFWPKRCPRTTTETRQLQSYFDMLPYSCGGWYWGKYVYFSPACRATVDLPKCSIRSEVPTAEIAFLNCLETPLSPDTMAARRFWRARENFGTAGSHGSIRVVSLDFSFILRTKLVR